MPKEIYIDENGNERILSSSPSALSGLLDTDITTPSANQVLAYDSNGKVVNKDVNHTNFPNIPYNIQDLANVVFGTLSSGQILSIESGTGNVINTKPSLSWVNTDFDNINHTGWTWGGYMYSFKSNSTGAPTTTGGYAMSFFNRDNNAYGCQLVLSNNGLYFRKLSNNSYGVWSTIVS